MSERKRIEVDGTLPDWEYTDATVDTAPPPRDWKPVVGEKVLVVDEATFDRMEDNTIAVVRWVHSGGYSQVPLYNIRPLRKEGE